jgi:hypothetical protein
MAVFVISSSMFFNILLGSSAFLVAGTAAFFSVLGIATLFSGSYYEVMIMAGALELGKLIATSFLYRFWYVTNRLLKLYLILAVIILMGITSMGIFGYLSAAYQANSSSVAHVESQITLFEGQKTEANKEIDQIRERITTLNESRGSQEKRLSGLSSKAAQPIYKDIEKSGEEIQRLNERIGTIQQTVQENDQKIIALKQENQQSRDIGTFKFIADALKLPLDTVVTLFICILICVFDPLSVSLVLAFNVAANRFPAVKNFNTKVEYLGALNSPEELEDYERYRKSKQQI